MSSTSRTSVRPPRTSRTAISPAAGARSRSASSGGSDRRWIRRLTRQLHAWIGLALSLILLVFGLTGSALVYKEGYWSLIYPELRAPAPELRAEDHARAFRAAVGEFGDRLRSVKLPEPGASAYHLYLEGGEAFLSATDHTVIDEWGSRDRLMSVLFDLHAHLLAGERGEQVGGVIGLLGVFLALTGLVLWWPARRQFAVRKLLPHGTSRRALVHWHRDLGVVSTPVLLVLMLSGSGLVFYNAAGALLNGLFGDRMHRFAIPAADAGPPVQLADAAILRRVAEELPQGRIVFYYPPRDGIGYHEFRMKQPCEMHPNGRSYVYLAAGGELLEKTDACAMQPGQKALHALYPLHAGKTGGQLYKLLTFLGGLALSALSVGGALAYAKQLGWIGGK